MIELLAIEIVSYTLLCIVVSFYSAYFLVLKSYSNKSKQIEWSEDFRPKISMIIPVYNEARIIRKKLQNIVSLKYPKENLEVIFVDGHSTDNTTEIIQSYIDKGHEYIKIIRQQERKGYNEGIFEGLACSSNDIVVLTDAASYYDSHALTHLVKNFKDPETGAVTGREVVINAKKGAGELESTYRSFYDFMRSAEAQMDSTPDLKGEISAARKDICLRTISKVRQSHNTSFDCTLPYQIRMEDRKVVYEDNAFYYEYSPETFKDRMIQQVRRGSILIAPLLLYKNMIFNGRYGKFGRVILPAHLIMLIVIPWIFLAGSISLIIATLVNPFMNVVIVAVLLIPVLVSRRTRIFCLSFVQSQIALLVSAVRVMTRRKSLVINTIFSTRK